MKARSEEGGNGGLMDSKEGQPWLADCDRAVAEFNAVAIDLFRQEWGEGEEVAIALMQSHRTSDGTQLDIGPRAVFLIENATGFVYKIGSDGRIYFHKCVGHVMRISGKDLFHQQWW